MCPHRETCGHVLLLVLLSEIELLLWISFLHVKCRRHIQNLDCSSMLKSHFHWKALVEIYIMYAILIMSNYLRSKKSQSKRTQTYRKRTKFNNHLFWPSVLNGTLWLESFFPWPKRAFGVQQMHHQWNMHSEPSKLRPQSSEASFLSTSRSASAARGRRIREGSGAASRFVGCQLCSHRP